MNIKKNTDYSSMSAALDALMLRGLPQMELYCEIGMIISARTEKGAAVAAAEYLQSAYPNTVGFSPRNVRRMRDFYRTYEVSPHMMAAALKIGWTQNVVIMEACEVEDERRWYLQAVQQFGWSKAELIACIAEGSHRHILLDGMGRICYTESEENALEEVRDEDSICLPRQHLPQPDGGVYDERFG